MPRISTFYGITIWMYYDENQHRGQPHFHATYGEEEASIDIETLTVISGELPLRARRLVVEWAGTHQDELLGNWERARHHQPLLPVNPLQ